MSTHIDLKNLKLGDLIVSAKGAKSIPITTLDGKPVIWQPAECLTPCFEPSAYNDPEASRVNLSLSPSDDIEKHLKAVDGVLASLLATDSQKYFGQVLTLAQVTERMLPTIRVSEKGHASLRLKMNISGRAKVQCYDEEKAARDFPEARLDVSLRPRIVVKSFWMIAKEIGLLLELQACQVSEQTRACPF